MPTFYRVDPNRSQPPQLFVIAVADSTDTLKNKNTGSCNGALQTLNNAVLLGSQNFNCTGGATITTDLYLTNP
jgi:hypothetical protein